MAKKVFWAVTGSFIGFVFIMFVLAFATANDQPTASPANVSPSSTIPAPTALKVSAEKLYADYDANEVAADNVYEARTLQVTGFISSIDKGPMGGVHVRMGADQDGINDVDAAMNDGSESHAAQLVKGYPVTVVCTDVSRIIGSVMLDHCKFASAE